MLAWHSQIEANLQYDFEFIIFAIRNDTDRHHQQQQKAEGNGNLNRQENNARYYQKKKHTVYKNEKTVFQIIVGNIKVNRKV